MPGHNSLNGMGFPTITKNGLQPPTLTFAWKSTRIAKTLISWTHLAPKRKVTSIVISQWNHTPTYWSQRFKWCKIVSSTSFVITITGPTLNSNFLKGLRQRDTNYSYLHIGQYKIHKNLSHKKIALIEDSSNKHIRHTNDSKPSNLNTTTSPEAWANPCLSH